MKKYKINYLHARQILDSRGNPTIEVECVVDKKGFGSVAIPSGASTGSYEALELRDGDKDYYNGKSVKKAVDNVNKLASELYQQKFATYQELDQYLMQVDGTDNKSHLGANAILGISLAFTKAVADREGIPLFAYLQQDAFCMPVPMMNILNGGKHADSSLTVQEFMIVPVGAESWSQALEWGVKVYQTLKSILHKEGKSTAVGDEGGFAPMLQGEEEALEYLVKAIKESGLQPGKQIGIALDVAASEMYHEAEKRGHITPEDESWDDTFNRIFISAVEPNLPHTPTVIKDYPKEIECLAKDYEDRPYKKRWELYINQVEVANCYDEETDKNRTRTYYEKEWKRMNDERKGTGDVIPAADFSFSELDMKASSGVAMGLDRLLMVSLALDDISPLLSFPLSDMLSDGKNLNQNTEVNR